MKQVAEIFAERLKELREEKGITLKTLADAIGVSDIAISRWENNKRIPNIEVLVAISMLSNQDENCRMALEQLPKFDGCQVHSTVMLSEVDRKIFKKLGVGLTCDPVKKVK